LTSADGAAVGTRRVHVGEVRLSIAEGGAGGRPLLLVHGLGGAKEDFTDWIAPLADRGWHAVAPDLRGHGASDKPGDEAAYSLESFARDLQGLLDGLGWRDAVVLGHSMGGMAVQTLVLDAPERARALVLMDTSDGPVTGVDPALVELAVSIVRTEGMEALVRAQAELADDAPLSTPAYERLIAERPDYVEFCEAKTRAVAPAMYAAMAAALVSEEGNPDRLVRLGGLRVPTLVVVGAEDEPFLEASHRMAAAIPGARLAVLPEGGHSPQFEVPELWWAAITEFLDGLAYG
jgi:3-oxoadipate enol-lactonase